MSKIHNMVRTLGPTQSPDIDIPEGWKLDKVVYLGGTTDAEKALGLFYTVLYVLVPDVVPAVLTTIRRGRKPVVEVNGTPIHSQ